MKRWKMNLIICAVVVLTFFFVYLYQKPIMTTSDAVEKTVECLNNPPERLGISGRNYTLKDIESVQTYLTAKEGLLGKRINEREWKVTITFEGSEATVDLNAYNGECLKVGGPLS
ncbi:hypothetical protein LCM20_01705 [Halobacillus litoralis]|uniref:hypothetical protein n=1 Tax=Halobacillus litoralis TaxID=45668 RepID=UPI001CD1EA01|nr:hypothetical protein [Halobacillus litoralis]MCA0969302.1 hypothetical protein [Halobacillus litoralis]